jgi:hypothetical protein
MKLLRPLIAAVAFALLAVPALAADLSVTAASVVAGTNAKTQAAIALSAVTAGQPLYRDTTTGKVAPADADSGTAAIRTPIGIALNSAGASQPVTYIYEGDLTAGATLTVGTIYTASDTAGGIRPAVDDNTGDYITVLGVASSASVLAVKLIVSGAAVP